MYKMACLLSDDTDQNMQTGRFRFVFDIIVYLKKRKKDSKNVLHWQ